MIGSLDMRHAVAVVTLAVFLAVPVARADGEAEQAARAVAETLVRDAHGAMTDPDLAEPARFAALEQAISRAFAFDVWERFLVGDHDLTDDQRQTFRDLLPGFLANLYAESFGSGLEAEPQITGARTVRRDVLVEARIPRADAPPLPVNYRIRDFAERGPLVIDVMVGGVSFLVLKRDEFRAMVERDGIDALLAFMRERAG